MKARKIITYFIAIGGAVLGALYLFNAINAAVNAGSASNINYVDLFFGVIAGVLLVCLSLTGVYFNKIIREGGPKLEQLKQKSTRGNVRATPISAIISVIILLCHLIVPINAMIAAGKAGSSIEVKTVVNLVLSVAAFVFLVLALLPAKSEVVSIIFRVLCGVLVLFSSTIILETVVLLFSLFLLTEQELEY